MTGTVVTDATVPVIAAFFRWPMTGTVACHATVPVIKRFLRRQV
jgi:hypothetical protein